MPTYASVRIEETITVTGETPVVDVQSTRQQRVLDREILDALPNSGLRTGLGRADSEPLTSGVRMSEARASGP